MFKLLTSKPSRQHNSATRFVSAIHLRLINLNTLSCGCHVGQTAFNIYLPILLNPRRGRVHRNQVLGVSFLLFFFVSFCAMLLVLVVIERTVSACLIILSGKQGSHWYHFNAFGMARPGIEPTTSRSRSGRTTICAIGTYVHTF